MTRETDLRGRDTCESCRHVRSSTVSGLAADGRPVAVLALFCHHSAALRHNDGARLSAGIARDYVCHGRHHPRGNPA
jgi:hypothetical protein